MKTGKIGAMFLISVLALAGIGMGYASWTDTITIEASVKTGSVEWHFTDVSGTWVYKNTANDDCIESDVKLDLTDPAYENYILVAWSEGIITGDHNARMEWHNIFPCIYFMADLEITYTGSVPGKMNSLTWIDGWNGYDTTGDTEEETRQEGLIDPCLTELFYHYRNGDLIGTYNLLTMLGVQLHKDDTVKIVLTIHLLQDDALEDISGDFIADIEVVQWNGYVSP